MLDIRYTKLSYDAALDALAKSLGGNVAAARRQLSLLCEMGFNVVGVRRVGSPSLRIVSDAQAAD